MGGNPPVKTDAGSTPVGLIYKMYAFCLKKRYSLFKFFFYAITMKGGGSREPLSFSVDPLFYLSSF